MLEVVWYVHPGTLSTGVNPCANMTPKIMSDQSHARTPMLASQRTYNLTKGMQRGVLRGHGVGRTRDFHYVFSGKAVRTSVLNLRANDIMPAEDPEDMQEVEEATYLLQIFTDSDWASCHGTRRSTSCAVLAWNGSVVFSYSRRQKAVSLSSGEA